MLMIHYVDYVCINLMPCMEIKCTKSIRVVQSNTDTHVSYWNHQKSFSHIRKVPDSHF